MASMGDINTTIQFHRDRGNVIGDYYSGVTVVCSLAVIAYLGTELGE